MDRITALKRFAMAAPNTADEWPGEHSSHEDPPLKSSPPSHAEDKPYAPWLDATREAEGWWVGNPWAPADFNPPQLYRSASCCSASCTVDYLLNDEQPDYESDDYPSDWGELEEWPRLSRLDEFELDNAPERHEPAEEKDNGWPCPTAGWGDNWGDGWDIIKKGVWDGGWESLTTMPSTHEQDTPRANEAFSIYEGSKHPIWDQDEVDEQKTEGGFEQHLRADHMGQADQMDDHLDQCIHHVQAMIQEGELQLRFPATYDGNTTSFIEGFSGGLTELTLGDGGTTINQDQLIAQIDRQIDLKLRGGDVSPLPKTTKSKLVTKNTASTASLRLPNSTAMQTTASVACLASESQGLPSPTSSNGVRQSGMLKPTAGRRWVKGWRQKNSSQL